MMQKELPIHYMYLISQTFFFQIEIYYTMSIVGTLCFHGEDTDILHDSFAFFDAISEIKPTVFFGPPSTYERIYHHFREMKKHTSGVSR